MLYTKESVNIKLIEKLLSLGGNDVADRYEEDLEKLLSRGELLKPSKVTLIKMETSQCHRNSSVYWDNYTRENGVGSINIVTGYGLGVYRDKTDNIWRQHTWLYLPAKNQIIETTVKRKLYFGFILTEIEADEFYESNW